MFTIEQINHVHDRLGSARTFEYRSRRQGTEARANGDTHF